MENNKTPYEEFGKDFIQIREYYDLLNKDESHYSSSNDICTSLALVKEMVDKIPATFWRDQNIKVLDCCCGNGNFLAYIGTKTKLDNMYFNELNDKRIENCYKYFGNDIHMTKKDFLEWDVKNDQYDLIVANPPYAKFTEDGKRAAKNHNLSRDFIKTAIDATKEGGYILFVVPDNWMSFSDRNILPSLMTKYQFRYISIHRPKVYFSNVGSTFTFFLLQKVPNAEPTKIANGYKIQDEAYVKFDEGINFIPLYCNPTVMSILNKTVNNNDIEKYKVETSSDLHKNTYGKTFTKQKDKDHPYKIWHTPRQCYFSPKEHKYQKGYKVYISLTTQWETFIDEDAGMTQSIAFIRCESKEEAKRINEELNNPLYKFINNITRYGNFGNNRVLERLPVLSEVHLTQEENDLINEFNKVYYKKVSKEKDEQNNVRNGNRNRTDILVEDMSVLENEVNFSVYDYKDYFSYLCSLVPNHDREAMETINARPEFYTKKGLIYIFVVEDKIFKIGQTTDTFEGRLQSYNCGRNNAREKGTCSVTNYFVLQSFLKLNKEVQVYAYYPPLAIYKIFDEDVISSEAPSKYAERIVLDDFEKKYYKKPIGCTQS